MYRHIIILRFIILSVISCLYSSVYAEISNLRFSNLTNDNGLSNNTVYCIYQDTKGFIWFGTEDGLNMYDGYEFRVFNNKLEDTTSITSNTVFDMKEDINGNFWVATSNGIDIFNKEFLSFKHVPIILGEDSLVYNSYIRYIFNDINNNVVIASATNNWDIFIYDSIKNGFIELNIETPEYEKFKKEGIEIAIIDSKKRIWIGPRSFNAGLFAYDLSNKKLIASPFSETLIDIQDKIYIIKEHPDGDIWIGTDNGIYIVKSDLSDIKHIKADKDVISDYMLTIIFEGRDKAWFGTRTDGLILYDILNNSYKKYDSDKFDRYALNNNSIYSLYKDVQGILWIGTVQGGVNFTQLDNKKQFDLLKKELLNPNSLNNDVVCSIFEDSDGNLWIGSDGGGLDYYNTKTGKFRHYMYKPGNPNTISGNSVLTINEDKNGKIWIGGYLVGVNIIDKQTGSIIRFRHNPDDPGSLSNDDVRDIHINENGHVWIATNGGGINKYIPKSNSFVNYRNQGGNSIVSDWCLRIEEDSYGKLWIGTYGGLSVYDPEKNIFTNYNSNNTSGSISDNWIYSFYEDSAKNMWIGTTKGLNVFNRNTQSFTVISKSEGLPNDVINGILCDSKNNLWISTNEGISKYNPFTKEIKNFDILDGLQGKQFVHGSYFKSNSGKLYFGGLNGMTLFYPDSIKINLFKPSVYFTDFQIFYKDIDINDENSPLKKSIIETDTIILMHNQSIITFKYAALNYVNPEKNQYKYMLSGFDDIWHDVGTRREATFTNLDPGTYQLQIIASNDDGIWNEEGAFITIIVLPPWWNTWVFRIIVLFIIIISIAGFYFYRINAIKKVNIELENQVKARTLEIERKNEVLLQQTEELNQTNTALEERQLKIEEQNLQIEEKNRILIKQTDELNETNTLLEERQQKVEEQSEELMVQKEEIQVAFDQVKELNEMKDRLFSIIGHDLKNPINIIMGFSELLDKRFDILTKEKIRSYIRAISESAQGTYILLENLLDWSRSHSGRYRFNPVNIILNQLMQNNLILLKEHYRSKNITVDSSVDAHHVVFADQNMIDTVLRNLISNAIKFTPVEGKISISSNDSENSNFISVYISDTGVGIPNDKIGELFRMDKSYSTEGTKGERGTGLGLLLCSEFIEKNGGKISVESKLGEGSTFSFTLPKA